MKMEKMSQTRNGIKKKSDNHRLILKKDAEDQKFLLRFLKDNRKNFKFDNPETLKQLWDVCRIPDYQNISDEKHVELLTKISAIISPLYSCLFLNFIFTPIFFKIVIIPILDGFMFTFLISNFDLFDSAARTIKKAAELMSEGIL